MADLYSKLQYIYVAGAYKSGSIYGIVPIPGTSNITLASASTSRTTSGSRTNSSYILEDIAPHILRVDYSDLVTCPSYKLEPSRTNYMAQSLYLISGSASPNFWQRTRSTWSLAVEASSPTGTGLAGFIREDTSAATSHILTCEPLIVSANTNRHATLSVYAKRSGSGAAVRDIMIAPFNLSTGTAVAGNIYFVLQGTGSILNPSNVPSTHVSGAYIEQVGNTGWYRCSITAANRANSWNFRIHLTSGSTGDPASYTGNGTSGVYVAAAQFESGSNHVAIFNPSAHRGTMITSYISSSISTVTRAGDDVIELPGPTYGTEFCVFMTYISAGNGGDPLLDASGPTDYILALNSGSAYAGLYRNGDVFQANTGSGANIFFNPPQPIRLNTNVEHKIALRSSASLFTYFVDGARISSASNPANWSGSTLTIGGTKISGTNTLQASSFYVRAVAVFSQSLTDAECIALTATGSGTL